MAEKVSNKKAQQAPEEEKQMSFWEHLEELRWHIVRSIIAVIVIAVVAFLNKDLVFNNIILGPSEDTFFTNRMLCRLSEVIGIAALCLDNLALKIININMSGQFLAHLYVSMVAGLVLAFPYLIWEIWRFVKPAMLPREKKFSRGGVLASSFLFLVGVLFSYYLIVPLTIHFLGTYQVSGEVENTISLTSYISTVVSVTLAVGVVFELPILVYFLTKIGILTPDFLKKNRKYMIVILLLLSAIITPPDVFSQIMVCIPLIGLYEVSIGISRRVHRRREMELAG